MIFLAKLSKPLLLGVAFALTACNAVPGPGPQSWESELYQSHPLVGRIWQSGDARFINEEQLLNAMLEAEILLLGEKHDNPDHHRLRLEAVNSLLLRERLSSISFEMLQPAQQQWLDSVDETVAADMQRLREHLNWDEAWNWQFYGPLLQAALLAQIPVRAANLDNDEVMEVYQGSADDAAARQVRDALSEEQLLRLYEDIDVGHCNRLPQSQLPAMVRVQQHRDLRMAQSLLEQHRLPDAQAREEAGSRLLIAGNYHIRHDLGVPNYLPEQPRPISVAWLEVKPEHEQPETYLQQFSGLAAYDYIWFTPAVTAEDYCEQFDR